jgi:hypothetical protein
VTDELAIEPRRCPDRGLALGQPPI